MSRSTKWKLAIVAGISECLVYTEAKYCAFEIHGEPKYYVCPRSEYCCNFGCCVSPGFQIYHLWYYWLLVIIMFLVCSGGGWWYRYWLQGRYRAAASAIPTRSSRSGTRDHLRSLMSNSCQPQQARISYNTSRNTVLLERMWKGRHRNAGSSAYSGPGAASSAAASHYHNTSVVLNDTNCPYYQLYGPPPSYETVIAQTARVGGKISSPPSPELLRPGMVPPPPVADPGFAPMLRCFYNVSPARLPPPPTEAPQYQPGYDSTAEYIRLMQQYGGPVDPGVSMLVSSSSPRHQLHQPQQQFVEGVRGIYGDRSGANTSGKSSENSDEGENTATIGSQSDSPDEARFAPMPRIDCIAGSSCGALDGARQLQQCHVNAGKSTPRVGVHGASRRDRTKIDSTSSSELVSSSVEPVVTTPSSCSFEGCSLPFQRRKVQGGSLKMSRCRGHIRQQQELAQRGRLSTADCEPTPSTSRAAAAAGSSSREGAEQATPRPSNPSSNVILAANATSESPAEADDQQTSTDRHHRHSQQQRPSIAEQSSTNSNLESKRKLDRSRSLD